MPNYKVAHISEQGIDFIIIPLNSNFGSKTDNEQKAIVDDLQTHASAAGLSGAVVPVWENKGAMAFRAPAKWHSFFRSIDLSFVGQHLNTQLSW